MGDHRQEVIEAAETMDRESEMADALGEVNRLVRHRIDAVGIHGKGEVLAQIQADIEDDLEGVAGVHHVAWCGEVAPFAGGPTIGVEQQVAVGEGDGGEVDIVQICTGGVGEGSGDGVDAGRSIGLSGRIIGRGNVNQPQ